MSFKHKLEQFGKIRRFIGKKSNQLILIGILTGVSLFFVETVFAYILQAFLVIMKIVPSSSSMNFPSWLPSGNPALFFLFVSLVIIFRGLARWLHSFLISVAYDNQRAFQKKRLVEWALTAKFINTNEYTTLYNAGIESVSVTLLHLQNIAILASTAFFIFLYLLKISLIVTCISIAILLMIAILIRKLDVNVSMLGHNAATEDKLINKVVLANIKNLLLLQIYGTQAKEKEETLNRIDRSLSHLLKYFKILHIKGYLPQTLGVILICGLCIVSTEKSWIPSGLMITYFYLFLQFVQNFSEIIKSASTLAFNSSSARNFAGWWADHSFDGVRNRAMNLTTSPPSEDLENIGFYFEHVAFRYGSSEPDVIHDFTTTIMPNTCTVIVGESGSGKSTLLSLALGLNRPTNGNIYLIDSNQKKIPLYQMHSHLLQKVGYVGPESYLIEGTIRENLIYGLSREPSQPEIELALEAAECGFIRNLKGSLGHHITEQGQGLSAGQKQRLSFARALLRNPKVLVLDEATSNLDAETEERLLRTIEKLKGKVTILAVTHRNAVRRISDQTLEIGKN